MKLNFVPTCQSAFARGMSFNLSLMVQAVCLNRGMNTDWVAHPDSFTVTGNVPEDIANVVRCVHRFVGYDEKWRRTCGFVMVYAGPAEALGAKTHIRWQQHENGWTVTYKKGNATAIAKSDRMVEAFERLLVAIARLPLTDETDGATIVA